ncbi:MAG: efflux RND transporter periplasmic adaptor subunit [Vicinamibacterales bacterium]
MRRRILAVGSCAAVIGLCACGQEKAAPPKPVAPAKVAATGSETTLATLTLTADAQRRLGIETAGVERQAVAQTRTLGADVMPAGGAQTTVTAPFTGTLSNAGVVPAVGASLAAGQTVLTLVPFAPAERDVRVEAERVVAEATGRQEMLRKRAERARQLVQDGAGSRRAVEEADADVAVADAALRAARERLALAARGINASGAVMLTAPHAALLRALHVMPGQAVAAGAPLFELVRLDTVWLRVPLFAGELDTVDRRASVEVVPLGAAAGTRGATARPVSAPPAADAAAASVDLFYSLANGERSLRPGQRVGVRVPLRSPAESLVVPRSAILFDALGGTWVYEARAGGVFVRQRVVLTDISGDTAVLQQGPAPGTPLVTVGAAELFGTEFGVGK